jgi:hypothetical protein
MKGLHVTSHPLSNLDGLIGLSRYHGVDIKPTLLRVLTDLYIQKPTHSADEASQYTTLALRLLDVVDVNTLAIVRQKLAAYAGAPAEVLRRLFGDEFESVTKFRIQNASQTNEADDTPRDAPSRGEVHPDAVGSGTTAAELTATFFAADSSERRLILVNLDYAGAIAIQRTLPGELEKAIRRLEQSALDGRPGDFVRELERALSVPRMIAQRIVNDPFGEPIVVAAKALGMPLPVLQRILLFVNPAVGHSVRRVYDLSALFDEISLQSAHHLVALWRDPVADSPRTTYLPAGPARATRPVREAAAIGDRARPGLIGYDEDLFLDRPQRRG